MRLAPTPPWFAMLAWSCSQPPSGDPTTCTDTFFADVDGDGFGADASATTACEAPPGYALAGGDCDDFDVAVHPGADEICNGLDDDCDATADDDATDMTLWYADADQDGFGSGVAVAACTRPAGRIDVTGDCADDDAAVNPDEDEICNDVDDDCDELTDSLDPGLVQGTVYYADTDGDGYGDPATGLHACELPADRVLDDADCDDTNALAYPLADEVCDHADNDCDGLVDIADDGVLDLQTYYADADGDGVGDDSVALVDCFAPAGFVSVGGDCDDDDPIVGASPNYYVDSDGDGYGAGTSFQSCSPTPDLVLVDGDCKAARQTVNPGAAETCDGHDNNCDDLVDDDDPMLVATTWYADADGDGYGDASTSVTACDAIDGYLLDATDCQDADAAIHPGATETCDGVDNDCDATVDISVVYANWYADDDGDGYGDPGDVRNDCVQPSGYVADADDCDDAAASTNPDATEICATGIDEDCDRSVDNCQLSSRDADVFVAGPETSFGQTIAALDLNADGVSDLVVPSWYTSDQAGVVYVSYGPLSAGATAADMVALNSGIADGAFGSEVTGGDADGDGVDDLFVGAEERTLADAYLFYGPVTSACGRTDADAVLDGEVDTSTGAELEIVQDFDGDGAADLVVGARDAGFGKGQVYVTGGTVSGTLDAAADAAFVYRGATRGGAFGWESESLGDTNGDGVDDLALGAPFDREGTVYVVEGGGSPGTYDVDAIAVASLGGPERESDFGYAIASADYDDDGTTDLVVGAVMADGTSDPNAGAVYSFLGPFAGALGVADADTTWIADCEFSVVGLGYDVAAGDIDGDKQADVVIGAFHSGALYQGAAFVQLGAATGTIEARTLPAIFGRSSERLGSAVALVPDWTGDDGAEVALGGPTYRDSWNDEVGALYLFESERFHP
jgi:hypothetical protein